VVRKEREKGEGGEEEDEGGWLYLRSKTRKAHANKRGEAQTPSHFAE